MRIEKIVQENTGLPKFSFFIYLKNAVNYKVLKRLHTESTVYIYIHNSRNHGLPRNHIDIYTKCTVYMPTGKFTLIGMSSKLHQF